MKFGRSQTYSLTLVLTLFFGLACVLAGSKPTPTSPPTIQPSNIPFLLPTPIPALEPSPTAADISPTPLPAGQIIPSQSKPLYQELSNDLNQFEIKLSLQSKARSKTTTFAVELAFANGNAGDALLTPQVLDLNKKLLNQLQAMGVRGVVVGIKYPLLKKGNPRADEYLKFYQNIMALCHQHNIKVLVEAGAIFSGTPYSQVSVNWSAESTASFLQGLQDQLVLISNDIKPDYLTLANEPTTDEALTHLHITPAVWQTFLQNTLKKVNHANGTLYGAGSGTWEDPEYIKAAFNVNGLDYIDLHIYPFNQDGIFLDRAVNYANQARAAGKKVVVSECWLFKAGSSEMSADILGNMEKVQNRDVFNFWTPLDMRYIKDIVTLADSTPMDFVSFFWMRNFFYNLTDSPSTENLSTQDYNRMMNQGAIQAVNAGTLSDLGQAFQTLLSDRAAP